MKFSIAIFFCFSFFVVNAWSAKCPTSAENKSDSPKKMRAYATKRFQWSHRDILWYFLELAEASAKPVSEAPGALFFLDTAKTFSKMTLEKITQFYLSEIARLKAKYGDGVWLSYDIELISVSLAHLLSRGNYDFKKWIQINQARSQMGQIWEKVFNLEEIGQKYKSFFSGPRGKDIWEKWVSLASPEEKKTRWNWIKITPQLIAADLPPDAYFDLNGIVFPEQTFGEVLGDLFRIYPPKKSFTIEDLGPHPGGDDYPVLQHLSVAHDVNSVEYRPGDETRKIAENGHSLFWLMYVTNLVPKLVQNQHYNVANGASVHLQTSFPKMPWVYKNTRAYNRRLSEIRQIIFLLAMSLQTRDDLDHGDYFRYGWDVMEIYSTSSAENTRAIQRQFGHFQTKRLFTHPLLQWELQTDWAMMPQKEWERTVTQIVQALLARHPELVVKIFQTVDTFDDVF